LFVYVSIVYDFKEELGVRRLGGRLEVVFEMLSDS
jgi:hypothetical protein